VVPGSRHDLSVIAIGPWLKGGLLLVDLAYYQGDLFNAIESCDPVLGCVRSNAPAGTVCGSAGMCSAGACSEPQRASYTLGHADLAIAYTPGTGFDVALRADGATIGGAPGISGDFGLAAIQVVTGATFTRPDPDSGYFARLCVGPGENVGWLPQSNYQCCDARCTVSGHREQNGSGDVRRR
jgi:hypothetical protein